MPQVIPSGHVRDYSRLLSLRLVLLLEILVQVTVTLGGDESVSHSTNVSHRISVGRHQITNVTKPLFEKSTISLSASSSSPPPPVVMSVSLPSPHTHPPDSNEELGAVHPTAYDADFAPTVTLINSASNSSTLPPRRRTSRKQYCSKDFAYLDKCLSHIPPMQDTGIPATPAAVESACKAFNMGMSCVDDWSRKCLQKNNIAKFKASISGAHETFTFLCQDPKFRQDFLKHGHCFKKVSNQWDQCSRDFIEHMKRFQTLSNSTVVCCFRMQFLQCVSEISHFHCDREAAQFLQKLAETLVRATMRTHIPPQCVSMQQRNCSMINSSARTSFFRPDIPIIISTILSVLIYLGLSGPQGMSSRTINIFLCLILYLTLPILGEISD